MDLSAFGAHSDGDELEFCKLDYGMLTEYLFRCAHQWGSVPFFQSLERPLSGLSPFLFLIIVEALSRLIKEARSNGLIRGVRICESEEVSHLLFVDDIFCSMVGSQRDLSSFESILNLYCSATGMMVNMEKSCIILNHCSKAEATSLFNIFPAQRKTLNESLKYFGFLLKPDCYRKKD